MALLRERQPRARRARASRTADRRTAPRPRSRSGRGRTRPTARRRRPPGSLRPASPSVVRMPAVRDDQLAGHPARLLGREERDRRRDVGRTAAARDRLQHLHELERLRVRARQHALGLGQPRRDGVDGDAVLAELARERARERRRRRPSTRRSARGSAFPRGSRSRRC